MNLLEQDPKFDASFPATESIRKGRGQAHAKVVALGMPTKKSEDWKYTSLKGLHEISWVPAPMLRAPLSSEQSRQITASLPTGFTNLVVVNGEFNPGLSSVLPAEIIWRESENFDLDSTPGFFESLQGVYFQKRYILDIPAETSVSSPIHILSVNIPHDSAHQLNLNKSLEAGARTLSGIMIQFHLTVTMGPRAKASLVESFLTLSHETTFSNVLTRASLAPNSSLSYLRIQRECDSAFHLGQTEFCQDHNSHLECLSLSLGGQLSRHQLQVKLIGSEATSKIHGAYVGRKNQHHDSQTAILHLVGGCSTQQVYKGLLDGKSRGVFNGKICIAHGAQKASSEQINSNLLLSPLAEVNSKPQLEIDADDVKATHGSTVGPLDPEELFYLLSRGIPKSKALTLLSFGFVAETVEKISDPLLKDLAISHLQEVFQKLESVNL